MTEERLDEIKEKVAEAEAILSDLEKLDDMIAFLEDHGGDVDHGCRLELKATYYPDDWITKPKQHPIEEEQYEDKSCALGTHIGAEIIKALEKCREELTHQFNELKV